MLYAKASEVFPVKHKLFRARPFVLLCLLGYIFQVPGSKLKAAERMGISVEVFISLSYIPAPAFRIVEKGHGKFKGSLRRDLGDGHPGV